MSLSRKQLALVHVAKAQLGMADDDYRAILKQEAGVESSRDLDDTGFERLMTRFQELGFSNPSSATPFRRPSFGTRPGMASTQQVELIRALYSEYKGADQSDAALGQWLERTFKVSSIRFLSFVDAQRVVGALKTMKSRQRQSGERRAS